MSEDVGCAFEDFAYFLHQIIYDFVYLFDVLSREQDNTIFWFGAWFDDCVEDLSFRFMLAGDSDNSLCGPNNALTCVVNLKLTWFGIIKPL